MKKSILLTVLSFITLPLFLNAQQCISDVAVEVGECEQGGIFTGFVTFESSPNIDSVFLFYDNNFTGKYATNDLPIELHPLQGDGQAHTVIVHDSESTSCIDSLVYFPFCDPVETCNSEILSVSSLCIDDVLHVTVNYNFVDPVSEVHIRVNGEFITNGMVGQNISQTFTVDTNPNSVYEIEILDPEFTECSDVAFLQVSPCIPNCIQQFDNGPITCNEDGTFDATFFLGSNVGNTNVYVDGQFVMNTFANDSTNQFVVESIQSDTVSSLRDLTVCLQNNPACCTTYSFADPLCTPIDTSGQCNIEIFSTSSDCSQEGLFIDVNYSYENPFSEAHVYVNGIFNSIATPGVDLFIGIFIPNPELIDYVIEIRDAEQTDCAAEIVFANIDCDPCEVFQYGFSLGCEPGGTYFISFRNRDEQSPVSVFIDSVLIGTHTAGMADLVVGGLNAVADSPVLVSICSDIYGCCTETSFDAPECNEDCIIELVSTEYECFDAGLYTANVTFDFSNTSGTLQYFVDGEMIDSLVNPPNSFNFGPFENGSFHDYLLVDAQNPDCFFSGDIFTQECTVNDPCEIAYIEVLDVECNDNGSYSLFAIFDDSNFYSNSVNVELNNQFIGTFSNSGSLSLDNLLLDTTLTQNTITICVNDELNCCNETTFEAPDCIDEVACSLEEPLITFECLDNGQYVGVITLDPINPTDTTTVTYALSIDGQFVNNFSTQSGLTFDFGPYQNGSIHAYSIVDINGNTCNFEGEIFTQECIDIPTPCSVDFIQIDSLFCRNGGTYDMVVSFESSNSGNNFAEVTVNGQPTTANESFGQLMLSDITPRTNSDFDIIEICINGFNNCCSEFEYLPPVCTPDSLCSISIVNIEYECLGNQGLYEAFVEIETENASGSYRLELNGSVNTVVANNNLISLGTFLNGTDGSFTLTDVFDQNCSVEGDFFWQECPLLPELCSVDFIEVDSIGCNVDGTYDMSVLFGTSNEPTNTVTISVNGGEPRFILNDGRDFPKNIKPIPGSNSGTIEICVNDFPDCCTTIEFLQPECLNEYLPCPNILLKVDSFACNFDGTYDVSLVRRVSDASNTRVLISVNGNDFFRPGQAWLGSQRVTVEPNPNSDFDYIELCLDDSMECCEIIEFPQPECLNNTACSINNIVVEYRSCNTTQYDIKVRAYGDYVGGVDIYINDEFITSYSHIENGNEGYYQNYEDFLIGENYTFKMVSQLDETCFLEKEFGISDCSEANPVADVSVVIDAVECNEDGTYNITIEHDFSQHGFDCLDLSLGKVNANGQIISNDFYNYYVGSDDINISNLFLDPNHELYFVRLTAIPENNASITVFFELPDCSDVGDNLCNVEFIEILETSCNNNGTFNMDVLYEIENFDNNSIDVFLNGDFFGFYDIDSLVTLEDIPLSLTNEVKTITICVNDNPDCCMTVDYNQPACGGTSECLLDDLVVEYECNDDTGEIIPLLTFNYDSTNTNEVIVNLNGINLGFFDPAQQPLVLDAILSNSADRWTITLSDASDPTCTTSAVLEGVDCVAECIITDLTVEEECIGDGTVLLYLDFFANNTSGEVMVNGNGTQYGVFDVAQLPIELGPLDPADNDVWEFVVTDVNLDNCSSFIEIDEFSCTEVNEIECLVEGLEVFNIECIGNNEYSMSVDFDVLGGSNVPFSFLLNGNMINSTNSSSLPLSLIGLIPNDTSDVETITICLDDLDNCCFDFEFESPNCLTDAVDQTLLDGVDLSPNPTRDIVNINHIPQQVVGLNILDNLGRSVMLMDAREDLQIDVSNFAQGIYTVQFFTADHRVMSMRFVKAN